MNYSSNYFIVLVLTTLVLYFLPFIPAWYEWKYKTDAEPIVAEGTITIGQNCFIGSSDSKTSIIAKHIKIAKGCYITGQILAKREGIYLG